jgi:hypothetical protein
MKKKKVETKSDFKNRIASICLGIPVSEVIMNKNARIEAAREKWVTKHFGSSHIVRKPFNKTKKR